jgi:cytochrome c-type biogenesis protein CcmH
MLFFIFAVLTGLTIFSVLWPLARAKRNLSVNEIDIVFYRAQLNEIERDKEIGQVAVSDAQAAYAAAARRLMNAVEAPRQGPSHSILPPRIAAVFASVAIPALALGLYLKIGHPDLPDAPLYAREDLSPREAGIMAAIAKVEAHPKAALCSGPCR